MLYTLNILKERVWRDLSGGDVPDDSPYDPDFIIATIIDCTREDLKLEILQRRAGNDDDRTPITQYIATYPDVEVKRDNVMKVDYFDIPSGYMSLKHNKGIYWVADMRSPSKQFIPVHVPVTTSRLIHGNFEFNNSGFYVEGLRGIFLRDVSNDGVSKLLLKLLIPAPDTIGYDDPLPIIPENVGRILDMAKNRIQNRVVQDRLADNNPNLRQQNV